MNAREEVLSRIRSALGPGPRSMPEVPRDYDRAGAHAAGSAFVVDLFHQRLLDYQATVRRLPFGGVAQALAEVLAERGLRGLVVVPSGIDRGWVTGTEVVFDHGAMTWSELDATEAVLTSCAVAIAETGTIVLDASPDHGRRAISLIPDLHVCVVRAEQIVQTVPDALRLLDPTRPLTLISGGSATSDIEMQRVEGVHGPRSLVVLILDDESEEAIVRNRPTG